jgi:predicted RNA binding protein YcfA (HicA-like mRNA interferase family)
MTQPLSGRHSGDLPNGSAARLSQGARANSEVSMWFQDWLHRLEKSGWRYEGFRGVYRAFLHDDGRVLVVIVDGHERVIAPDAEKLWRICGGRSNIGE